MTLDILDAQGKSVRHLSSKEKEEDAQPPEWPDQVEAPKTIPAKAGMNRFAWDLRHDAPGAHARHLLFREQTRAVPSPCRANTRSA